MLEESGLTGEAKQKAQEWFEEMDIDSIDGLRKIKWEGELVKKLELLALEGRRRFLS